MRCAAYAAARRKAFSKGDRCYKPSVRLKNAGPNRRTTWQLNASWQGVGRIWPAVARKAEVKRIYFILEGQFRNYFDARPV